MYRRRKHASECIFTIKVYKNILFSYLNCCFKLYHVSQNTTLSYLLNRSFFDNLHCPFFFRSKYSRGTWRTTGLNSRWKKSFFLKSGWAHRCILWWIDNECKQGILELKIWYQLMHNNHLSKHIKDLFIATLHIIWYQFLRSHILSLQLKQFSKFTKKIQNHIR